MTHPALSLREFEGAGYDKGRSVVWQVAWLALRTPLSAWFVPAKLRVLVLRVFGARIGDDVLIRHGVKIHWPWKLVVGNGSWLGEGAWILNLEDVEIGSDVCISQDVLICSGSHQRRSRTFEFDNAPIRIADRAWIGARAVVLRGVVVGPNCVVGANTVVASDLGPGSVVISRATSV
ncbi:MULTISPECIES: DapH/DapD/GlmU-related protein [Gordonia]|uniref:DapH/DapD/GlmU-related protein n=1 Tax=Gordonia TaxID=2053 RepID=UPI000BB7A834|nr:DapH/DapD/GlmU-related protein [Gordonia sp. 1D]ATD69829.1 putative colanic acid biosynthesis acetyltransferase [Gordonia sp. 1D]UOG21058.1 putative colanic acid biosynthesis acetyltransferase [Gordonia amicalis]